MPEVDQELPSETQLEGKESTLVPERALEEEKGLLQKLERLGGGKMKRVIASLMLGSALVFGVGAFEANAGERTKTQQWVEDVGTKSMQDVERIQNSYQEEARQVWEKFAGEVERIKREYPKERLSQEITPRVLEIIKNMREYPSNNPAQQQIMEREFVKTWLFNHAEVTKGIDTRKERLTLRDAQESANALNRTFIRSFDANGDEVLDRNEIAAYESAIKGSRGLSILQGIKLFEQRGTPPSR